MSISPKFGKIVTSYLHKEPCSRAATFTSAVLVEVTSRGALYRSVDGRKTKDELHNIHKSLLVDKICESTQIAAIS